MRTRTQSSAPLALKACAAFVMAALPTLALSQSFEYKRFHPGLNVAPPPAVVQEPPTPPDSAHVGGGLADIHLPGDF